MVHRKEKKKRNIPENTRTRERSGGESGNVEKYEIEAMRVRGEARKKGIVGGERVESFTADYYGRIAKR